MFKAKPALAVFLVVFACAAAVVYHDKNRPAISSDTILLLLPDSANDSDVSVQVWLDAAAEEGFHLRTTHDSALLDPMFHMEAAGLIVPDQVHRQANDALIGALHRYVDQGGQLMIVYDACTWDLRNRYASYSSRLSDLAGVDYALYDRFGTQSIASGSVWGTAAAMRGLAIPPGSYSPRAKEGAGQDASSHQMALHGGPEHTEEREALVGYLYGELDYPTFRTAGEFQGKTLLWSNTGLAAGENRHGLGDVLFVNLPLGYLETRTDGLLLHSFLRYFGLRMLHSPCLATAPDGTGGMVMNWHIDSESALKSMEVLRHAGLFDQGSFSVDLSAGPDVDEFHDGKGLNLQNNADARSWLQFLLQRGEVGSHGGWIHNYFGRNLSDTNQEQFQQYLALNMETIAAISGRAVNEYSAPLGNQPAWVTRWLENHGVIAYCFTGDSGMGPTRVYRDQGRDGQKIWAFPILHLGQQASLEEMDSESVAGTAVRNWLVSISDFTAREHAIRLIYSHPAGAARYVDVLRRWFRHANELAAGGRFRWYTMAQAAGFLNARQDVSWKIAKDGADSVFSASHPRTLAHQAWMLSDMRYDEPRITVGSAEVRDQDGYWIVAAKDCKLLKARFAERQTGHTRPQSAHLILGDSR